MNQNSLHRDSSLLHFLAVMYDRLCPRHICLREDDAAALRAIDIDDGVCAFRDRKRLHRHLLAVKDLHDGAGPWNDGGIFQLNIDGVGTDDTLR